MRIDRSAWLALPFCILLSHPAPADERPYIEYQTPIYYAELFELRLREVLPEDAAAYVDAFRSCRHWEGEDAYNDERAKQINEGIESSCTGLENKKQALISKYPIGSQESETLQTIIKQVETDTSFPSFVLDDPHRTSAVLNRYYEAQAQSIVREVNTQLPSYLAATKNIKQSSSPASIKLHDEVEMKKYMLDVQQRYLTEVMKNADRLHPSTLEKIKQIQPELNRALSISH